MRVASTLLALLVSSVAFADTCPHCAGTLPTQPATIRWHYVPVEAVRLPDPRESERCPCTVLGGSCPCAKHPRLQDVGGSRVEQHDASRVLRHNPQHELLTRFRLFRGRCR